MSIPSDRRTVSSILNDLKQRVRVLEALPASGGGGAWADLTLLNGWQAAGPPYASTIQYRSDKVMENEEDLRGVLDSASAESGAIVGILPPANRPATKLLFEAAIANAAGEIGLGIVTVSDATGAIVVYFTPPPLAPYMPGSQLFSPYQMKFANASNDCQVVQDSTVIGAGFARITAAWSPAEAEPENGGPAYPAYITLPVWLGKPDGQIGRPYRGGAIVAGSADGGYWSHFVVRKGPDTPTYAMRAANAVVNGYAMDPFSDQLNWVDIKTGDLYAAASSWEDEALYLQPEGNVGDQFTSYSVGDGGMDGPPGLYWFCFIRTGKNASSSGYVFDIAEFGVSGIAF